MAVSLGTNVVVVTTAHSIFECVALLLYLVDHVWHCNHFVGEEELVALFTLVCGVCAVCRVWFFFLLVTLPSQHST